MNNYLTSLLVIISALVLMTSCKKESVAPASYWQFDDTDSVNVAYKEPHDRLTAVPINSDSNSYGYYEYLPQAYFSHPQAGFPLVLFLHGNGQAGDGSKNALDLLLNDGVLKIVAHDQADFGFVCIAPQAPEAANDGFHTWDAQKLNDFLEYLLKKYRIKPEKVYVTGFSAGGMGTIIFAQSYANRLAAIAPISGDFQKNTLISPLKNLPMWCFVNSGDKRYAAGMEAFVADVKQVGGRPIFTEYNAQAHNAWDEAYNDNDFWKWLLSQSR